MYSISESDEAVIYINEQSGRIVKFILSVTIRLSFYPFTLNIIGPFSVKVFL